MLIESTELLERIKRMRHDVHESKAYFSQFKAAMDCIDKLIDIIEDMEATTAGKNVAHKYSDALEGLKEK